MLGFLKGDPKKKLQKEYEAKLQKALHAQRNGDLGGGALHLLGHIDDLDPLAAQVRPVAELHDRDDPTIERDAVRSEGERLDVAHDLLRRFGG